MIKMEFPDFQASVCFPVIWSIKKLDLKIRQDFQRPVLTSRNSIWVRPTTHHQGVPGSCPAGPNLRIKHIQRQSLGVFFYPLLPRDCIVWQSALPNYDDIVQYTFFLDIIGSAAKKKQLIDKNLN